MPGCIRNALLNHGALWLEQVREAAQLSNHSISEKYALISTEVMKVPANGEDVLALKKYIAECREEHDKLMQDIEFNKQREVSGREGPVANSRWAPRVARFPRAPRLRRRRRVWKS